MSPYMNWTGFHRVSNVSATAKLSVYFLLLRIQPSSKIESTVCGRKHFHIIMLRICRVKPIQLIIWSIH